jgi:hypothetical protein
MYRPSRLFKAYGSAKKYWLMYVGLLTTIFSILIFFFLARLSGGGGMSGRSCGLGCSDFYFIISPYTNPLMVAYGS